MRIHHRIESYDGKEIVPGYFRFAATSEIKKLGDRSRTHNDLISKVSRTREYRPGL